MIKLSKMFPVFITEFGVKQVLFRDELLLFKDPGTALMVTKPIQLYTNENRL